MEALKIELNSLYDLGFCISLQQPGQIALRNITSTFLFVSYLLFYVSLSWCHVEVSIGNGYICSHRIHLARTTLKIYDLFHTLTKVKHGIVYKALCSTTREFICYVTYRVDGISKRLPEPLEGIAKAEN